MFYGSSHVYRPPPLILPRRRTMATLLRDPQKVRPNGNGSVAWTPSAGTNYECVDEAVRNDSDYNTAPSAGLLDSYDVPTYDDPGVTNGFIVRYAVPDAPTGGAGVQVRLYEGTTLRSTGPTVYAAGEYQWNVPAADVANITDRAAVRVAVYSV